ncbi:hypothetical protein HYT18_02420 [Candidatus Microgenomates bacterium]|nr:hypothetical protein [Candidatus Microgenomates bacterium]
MSETILNTILKDTYTLTLLKHRLRVLKNYLLNQLFTASKVSLNPEDLTWLNSLGPAFYQQFNKDNVEEIFSRLEAEIKKEQLLYLYLPFVAGNQVVSQIGGQIRHIFEKVVLFEIRFDPSLIAGCAISWKGVYRDYSLRAKIDQRKGEILQSFKKFLR